MEPRTPDEFAAIQKYKSSIPLTREEIITLQKLRNASLLDEEKSPVPLELREKDFKGIDFFPIHGKYQLRLRFHKYASPEPVQISLSNGQKVDALRAGYFAFELEGKQIRLYAYKKHASDTEMFLPFKDETSGRETYGAGRYLDLYGTSDDNYVLDFNLAYNPLCAFDEKKYDCPLPPTENWLMNVEIRAGEMKLKS
jgi:uncharacterized protein (DUF1684 family)